MQWIRISELPKVKAAITKIKAKPTGMQYAVFGFIDECPDDLDVYRRDIEAESAPDIKDMAMNASAAAPVLKSMMAEN